MIASIFGGAAIGFLVGSLTGLACALWARDGIWPSVWAWLAMTFAIIGAAIGAIDGVM